MTNSRTSGPFLQLSFTHIHLTRSLLSICGLDCSRLSKKRTKFMFHYIVPAVISKVIYQDGRNFYLKLTHGLQYGQASMIYLSSDLLTTTRSIHQSDHNLFTSQAHLVHQLIRLVCNIYFIYSPILLLILVRYKYRNYEDEENINQKESCIQHNKYIHSQYKLRNALLLIEQYI